MLPTSQQPAKKDKKRGQGPNTPPPWRNFLLTHFRPLGSLPKTCTSPQWLYGLGNKPIHRWLWGTLRTLATAKQYPPATTGPGQAAAFPQQHRCLSDIPQWSFKIRYIRQHYQTKAGAEIEKCVFPWLLQILGISKNIFKFSFQFKLHFWIIELLLISSCHLCSCFWILNYLDQSPKYPKNMVPLRKFIICLIR